MRLIVGCGMLLLSCGLVAQSFGNLDPAQIQMLMEQAQQAQICLEKADKAEVEALKFEAEATRDDLQQLCMAGERDTAQATAISFSKKSLAQPVVQEFQSCMGVVGTTLPLLAMMQLQNPEATNSHVCDLELPR